MHSLTHKILRRVLKFKGLHEDYFKGKCVQKNTNFVGFQCLFLFFEPQKNFRSLKLIQAYVSPELPGKLFAGLQRILTFMTKFL